MSLLRCFDIICNSCAGHAFPCTLHDLVGFADAMGHTDGRISVHSNRICLVGDDIFDPVRIKSNDHAGEIVSAESRKSMVDKNLGGLLGILNILYEINSFLVTTDVPQLKPS